MWLPSVTAFLTILAAGASANVAQVNIYVGEEITFMVFTIGSQVDGCYVKTPSNQIIEFKPENGSVEKRYELLDDNHLTACQVKITIADDKDSGRWSIYFTENSDVKGTEEYDVTVKSPVPETEDKNDLIEEKLEIGTEGTQWLTPVDYLVSTGMVAEISIRKLDDISGCTLFTPNRTSIDQNKEAHGVAFIPSDTEPYTSCRVQIGPINDNTLLGDWYLCSQKLEDSIVHQECQKATLSWNNDNPDSYWSYDTQQKFEHPVHYTGKLTLSVINPGTLKSCHIITPTGNDLAVTEDSNFPYVTRVAPFTECHILISPIDSLCIGEWVIYGIYTDFTGVTEVRLPTKLFLYDANNPHEQAYNVTKPDPLVKVVNMLNSIELEVSGNGEVDKCDITPPTKIDNDNNVIFTKSDGSCKYSVGPIDENMLGDWLITAKFSRNNLFSEIQQVFTVKQEDPHNPEVEENRIIRDLEPIQFRTTLGASHDVYINGEQGSRIIESCHVRTPDGRQYSVIEGFHIPGIEAERGTNCEVHITVVSEEMVGDWTLIARKLDYSLPVEERLKFTIYVEKEVAAVPSRVTIFESQDLALRLQDKTENYETCKLYSPEGEFDNFQIEPDYLEYCAFIVKNVDKSMNGTWQIVYENKVVYKASIDVNVVDRKSVSFDNLTWLVDGKVDAYTGPDDVSYCILKSPLGEKVFDGFGQCKVAVSRVQQEHSGLWTATVGHQGKILMDTHSFTVDVKSFAEFRPSVKTRVYEITKPKMVSMSCSIQSLQEIQICKFRDPQGEVLIASEGVSEDRFVAYGSSTYINGVYYYECGLRISPTAATDAGVWRCAIATSNDTFYGFLNVKGDHQAKSEPVTELVAHKTMVDAVVGDDVIMTCNVMTKIDYCYFRKANGTVYNLSPMEGGGTSDISYYGAGLDAGDCGIKFNTRNEKDSGIWSCNVGINDVHLKELKKEITLNVNEEFKLKQYSDGPNIVVTATATQLAEIDYCRYVRADGLAFSTHTGHANYRIVVANNVCTLRTRFPESADYRPWAVSMRLHGSAKELSGVTSMYYVYYYYTWNNSVFWMWLAVTLIGVSLITLGCSLGPKKNRDWTFERARSIRASLRSSFRKAPLALPTIIEEKPPAYSVQ